MNNGENRKNNIDFFHLFLVNFVVATQFAMAVFLFANSADFKTNLIFKVLIFSLILPSITFISFLEIFNNPKSTRKFFQQGLVFLILGNLIALISNSYDLFIFAITISGFGGGMVIFGQLNLLREFESKKRNWLIFFKILFLVLGVFWGPYLMLFLAGPNFDALKTSLTIGAAISMLAFLELSQIYVRFEFVLKKIFAKVLGQKKRFALMGLGIIVNNVIIDYFFDFVLYPIVIWKAGIVKGGIVMTFLSAVACYLTLLFYDWSKKDWLGLETIKSVRDGKNDAKMGRVTSWILKKSDPMALMILSINFDPFITTVYMRKGSHNYSGMGKRDWTIFVLSLFIANVYWTLISFTGISFVEWVWKMFE